MSYYGFFDDDYKEGQRDFKRHGRPSAFDRDRYFGGERDEAYFRGFDEAKQEKQEEERREEEQYQEEQQREHERQQQLEDERIEDEYNQQPEEEIE